MTKKITKPTVIDDIVHYPLNGSEYKIPLRVNNRLARALRDAGQDDAYHVVFDHFEKIMHPKQFEELLDEDIVATQGLVEYYFEALGEKVGNTPGESLKP